MRTTIAVMWDVVLRVGIEHWLPRAEYNRRENMRRIISFARLTMCQSDQKCTPIHVLGVGGEGGGGGRAKTRGRGGGGGSAQDTGLCRGGEEPSDCRVPTFIFLASPLFAPK